VLIPKPSAVLAIGVCVAAIACGSTSPVSPRGTSGLFSTGGAVITGHVNGAPLSATAQSATARPMASPTTVTVTIVGTDIATTVDGKGDFQLTGVPPGDVTLKFTNAGASAVITLSGVAAGDRIHIVVTLNGNAAKIEHEDRDHDDDGDDEDEDDDELKGLVSNLTGTCPTLTFTVAGTKVVTNSATKFDDPCQQIANGRRVEVKGTRQTDGSIVATKVEFD
jgi:hypothetical protein